MESYGRRVLDEAQSLALTVEEIRNLEAFLLIWRNAEPSELNLKVWQFLCDNILKSSSDEAVHQRLFQAAFSSWPRQLGPPPAFVPHTGWKNSTNIASFFRTYKGSAEWESCRNEDPAQSWELLQKESVKHPEQFWPALLAHLQIRISSERVLALHDHPDSIQWFPGARCNIAQLALDSPLGRDEAPAVVWAHEADPTRMHTMSRAELRQRSLQVASTISAKFQPGDVLGLVMPMTPTAVAIYLGTILAGCAVVSVPESFAAPEVMVRLKIAGAKALFTQDVVLRGGKVLPLYTRIIDHNEMPPAIVLSADDAADPRVRLRAQDSNWSAFLKSVDPSTLSAFTPFVGSADAVTSIMMSSGTTGEPKAIPWTHLTPLRCVVDGWAHQDIRPGGLVGWPTSFGWMMGAWLVYASLMNGAAMALYEGSPLGRDFGDFVCASGMSVLGVVPSMVRAWRSSGCMAGLTWPRLRCISSTGEASSPDDYFWLSTLIGHRPIIEYCGGTELGGAFLSSVQVKPIPLSVFNTPTLGARLVLLPTHNGDGPLVDTLITPTPSTASTSSPPSGELAVVPPMLGGSQRLLNKDHFKVYYAGMPRHAPTGRVLRRHGDEMAQLPGGYLCALGRVDDTMNLGGIKVSSVELERAVLEEVRAVHEVAAVGVPAPGGGPERLYLFVVPAAEEPPAASELLAACNAAIRSRLNPMFKVEAVTLRKSLPRTPSNKIMRRTLRDEAMTPMSKL